MNLVTITKITIYHKHFPNYFDYLNVLEEHIKLFLRMNGINFKNGL
jgi:hypothetical protein